MPRRSFTRWMTSFISLTLVALFALLHAAARLGLSAL
jgi:hypothetical protein